MTKSLHDVSSNARHDRLSLPSVEDAGLDDRTVAAPVLGYGMERESLFAGASDEWMSPEEEERLRAEEQADAEAALRTLGKHEVAAVSFDLPYYVSDASPYLTDRQAQEDVRVTRRRHSVAVGILSVLLLGGLLGAGAWYAWNSVRPPQQAPVAQYETAFIEAGEFLETVDASSVVRPVNQQTVTAEVMGTVAEMFVEEGSEIAEGAPLLRLENQTVSDAAWKAQQALDAVNGLVQTRQDALDEANKALEKAQKALDSLTAASSGDADEHAQDSDDNKNDPAAADEDGDNTTSPTSSSSDRVNAVAVAAARSAVESAQAEVDRAQTELDAVRTNQQSVQETYDRAIAQQNALTVLAPISGRIDELDTSLSAGQTVRSSAKICVVSDVSRLSVSVEIPADYAARVLEGMEARIRVDAADLDLSCPVTSVNTEADPPTALIVIDNPDENLASGMACDVSVVLQSVPDSLIVPMEALRVDEEGATHLDILLDSSRGIVTDVPVQVVATNGTQAAVVASSIQADTEVVLPGSSSED